MSQGAIRPETPRDREERSVLETDLAESPVKGQALRTRLRNFRPDAESAVRALGGPLFWMRRSSRSRAVSGRIAPWLMIACCSRGSMPR